MNNDLINIVNLDYETLLEESLILKDKYASLRDWELSNQSDPLGLILEAYLRAIVRSSNFANLIAQEFSMASAITQDSVFEKAFLAGYNVTLRNAATCSLNLTINPGNAFTIAPYELILQGSNNTGGVVYFENVSQISLPQETLVTELSGIEFIEGRTNNIQRTGTGEPFQGIVIQDDIIDGTIQLTVNGISWTEVFSINSDRGSEETIYEVRNVGEGTYLISCGDNVNGRTFIQDSIIDITYRSGSGSSGNILTFYIDSIFSTPTDRVVSSSAVNLTDRASGGSDQEDVEKVRTLAPKLSKTSGFIGNRWDMDLYVNSYAGVGIGKATEAGFNYFKVYIANEVGSPTQFFLDQLRSDIEERLIIGARVEVENATKIYADVSMDVVYDLSYRREDIELQIRTKFLEFLNPFQYVEDRERKLTFGSDLLISDVYETITEIPGVVAMSITDPTPSTDIILINVLDNQILASDGSNLNLNMIPVSDSPQLRSNYSEKYFFNNPKYR